MQQHEVDATAAQQQLLLAQQQLVLMQQELEKEKLKAQEDAAFNFAVELNGCPLPAVGLTHGDDQRSCAMLYAFVSQWVTSGGAVPFAIENMAQQDSDVPKLTEMVFKLLGGKVWAQWGTVGGSSAKAILPRQLVWLLNAALLKLASEMQVEEGIKTAAAQSFTVASDAHKRKRAAPS